MIVDRGPSTVGRSLSTGDRSPNSADRQPTRALELVGLSQRVIAELPAGHGFLADQLRRAASSVALTFAEGHDKPSRPEQRRYFRMALGSAAECAAIFDVAARLGAIHADEHRQGAELCDHIVRMLYRFRA